MCYLVITSQQIYFDKFLLHENAELCIWNQRCSDKDPYLANSVSKYSDKVLGGKKSIQQTLARVLKSNYTQLLELMNGSDERLILDREYQHYHW